MTGMKQALQGVPQRGTNLPFILWSHGDHEGVDQRGAQHAYVYKANSSRGILHLYHIHDNHDGC